MEMVRFFQIYKKASVIHSILLTLGVSLISCASKSTDLFIDSSNSLTNEHLLSKPTAIQLEQSSVYYLSIFTSGEFDKFESNIFDQLRISLFSQARYRYPEYELLNVAQFEDKNLFKTRYTVKGDLILKKTIREKMNLIIHHQPFIARLDSNDTTTSKIKETASAESLDSAMFFNEAHLEAVRTIEVEELAELLVIDMSDSTIKTTLTSEAVTNKEYDVKKEEKSQQVTPLSSKDLKDIILAEPQALKPSSVDNDTKTIEPNELLATKVLRYSDKNRNGETVYIVACFRKDGFVEEKVFVTEKEIGYPVEYYVTDKWIRVYLKDVASSSQAKAIFYESWPCAFGK
jgi:hypothetical protein|tara:strand:+ start:115 stop:1149 length:1035 start_codon:yes stop_codon:yes gene_type:complete